MGVLNAPYFLDIWSTHLAACFPGLSEIDSIEVAQKKRLADFLYKIVDNH